MARFRRRRRGTVVIDWLALIAGILLLGIAVATGVLSGGVGDVAESVTDDLNRNALAGECAAASGETGPACGN